VPWCVAAVAAGRRAAAVELPYVSMPSGDLLPSLLWFLFACLCALPLALCLQGGHSSEMYFVIEGEVSVSVVRAPCPIRLSIYCAPSSL
jgi:hypothetical protein